MTRVFTVEDKQGRTHLATTSMKDARRLIMNLGRNGHDGCKMYYWRRSGLSYQIRYDIDATVRTRKVMSFDEWFVRRQHIQKQDRLERVFQEPQDADRSTNA